MSRLDDAGYVKTTKTFVGKRPRTTCRLSKEGRAVFEGYRDQVTHLLNRDG